MALDGEEGLLPVLGSSAPGLAPVGGGCLIIRLGNLRPRPHRGRQGHPDSEA